jgi:transposase
MVKLMRKLLKKYGFVPDKLVTDELRSYAAAAIVALARRLAVIMHRMWSDGTEFRWTREMAPTI